MMRVSKMMEMMTMMSMVTMVTMVHNLIDLWTYLDKLWMKTLLISLTKFLVMRKMALSLDNIFRLMTRKTIPHDLYSVFNCPHPLLWSEYLLCWTYFLILCLSHTKQNADVLFQQVLSKFFCHKSRSHHLISKFSF